MAFDVSYIFTAKEKYTAIAKKVANSNKFVKSTIAGATSANEKYKRIARKVASANDKVKATVTGAAVANEKYKSTAAAAAVTNQRTAEASGIAAFANERYAKSAKKTAAANQHLKNTTSGSNVAFRAYTSVIRKASAAKGVLKTKAVAAANAINGNLNFSLTTLNATALRTKGRMEDLEKRFEGITHVSQKIRNVGLGMSAAITLPFVLASNKAINLASDARETASKFDQVFSEIAGSANNMADKFGKSFGVAGSTARKMLGDTGDLLVGFGFTEKAGLDLSLQVNKLASDLASFQNFEGGMQGASIALTKALLGETESAKALGIVIRQGTKEFKTNVEMIQRTRKVSLLQAKAIEILRIASTQSEKAIGDVSRTWDDYANVQRRSSEATKETAESFGKVLLPVALKLQLAYTKTITSIGELSLGMKKVILVGVGLVAVLGPLLLLIGSIGLALPLMASGAAAVGTAFAVLTGPVGIVIALTAALLFFLAKSKTVRAFFAGVGLGLRESIGPTLTILINDLKSAAGVITELFGSGSDADSALEGMSDNMLAAAKAGRLMGDIIGGTIDAIVTSLRVVGDLIGQVVGAMATLDFSQFDLSEATTGIVDFAARIGLVDLPDVNLTPTINALPGQTAMLELVPEVVGVVALPGQTAMLELVPEVVGVVVPGQTAMLELVPEE